MTALYDINGDLPEMTQKEATDLFNELHEQIGVLEAIKQKLYDQFPLYGLEYKLR